MEKCIKSERGMVIVEASIVFPVMFFVIFLMLYAGNAYLQKCRVESYVNHYAIQAAAYCADPMLDELEKGKIPSLEDADVQPYRYFFGGMRDIEANIEKELTDKIKGMSSGLFAGMKPSNITVDAKYNNGFIYSTFSIDVEYKVRIPIKLLGASDYIYLHVASHADMPVSDTTEFIRNVNMIEDYLQKTGISEEIEKLINKAKEWIGK